jgi:hypothetical protein
MNAEDIYLSANIELKHKETTVKILRVFFKVVFPHLGYGFLEKNKNIGVLPRIPASY